MRERWFPSIYGRPPTLRLSGSARRFRFQRSLIPCSLPNFRKAYAEHPQVPQGPMRLAHPEAGPGRVPPLRPIEVSAPQSRVRDLCMRGWPRPPEGGHVWQHRSAPLFKLAAHGRAARGPAPSRAVASFRFERRGISPARCSRHGSGLRSGRHKWAASQIRRWLLSGLAFHRPLECCFGLLLEWKVCGSCILR